MLFVVVGAFLKLQSEIKKIMKTKVKLEDVKLTLDKNQVESNKAKKVLEDLNRLLAETVKEEKAPKSPKEYVLVVSDPEGHITKDLVGWAVQIEEGESPHGAVDKIKEAARAFNQSKKGKRMPLTTIGETIEVATKFTRESKVWAKNKVPVLVIPTDNKI